ncbi:MAG: hypothetical protein IK101_04080 [Oscillospiraceae bacterium]|nr:hypothetical protein [Oscillospiraceae bacterium]
MQRNYGRDTGELYKPDSMSFGGGGRGLSGSSGSLNSWILVGISALVLIAGLIFGLLFKRRG